MTRVWVTRDEPPDGELAAALREAGLEPVLEPVLQRKIVTDLGAMLRTLGGNDWLVLTSAFAARAIDGNLVRCRVAVVGPATREAAARAGMRAEMEGAEGTGEALWKTLFGKLPPGVTVCYPRSSLAQVPDVPKGTGVKLIAPVFYETVRRAFDAGVAKTVDVAAVASPSAADAMAGIAGLPPCASIGPTTSTALRELGIEPCLEAQPHTFEGLARAIASRFTRPGRRDATGPSPERRT